MSSSDGRFVLSPERRRNCAGRAATWILVILLLLVAGGFTFLAVVYKMQNDPKTARALKGPMPVEAVKAKVRTIKVTVGASGQALQYTTVNVTSRITSNAQEVPVNIGDLVTKQQELLHADRRLFEAALTAAESRVTANQSEIEKDDKDLEGIKALYAKGLAALIEVQQAQAALDKAKADL